MKQMNVSKKSKIKKCNPINKDDNILILIIIIIIIVIVTITIIIMIIILIIISSSPHCSELTR